jgi:hypothetical protein
MTLPTRADPVPSRIGIDPLHRSWLDSAPRLEGRCAGLTDAELL